MPTRHADVTWDGGFKTGEGTIDAGSGAFSLDYSVPSRFEDDEDADQTNPEELLAGAHAGCFAMALAGILEEEGYDPERIHASADIAIENDSGDFVITTIELYAEVDAPDLPEDELSEYLEDAKDNCPVSQALASVDMITVEGHLKGT